MLLFHDVTIWKTVQETDSSSRSSSWRAWNPHSRSTPDWSSSSTVRGGAVPGNHPSTSHTSVTPRLYHDSATMPGRRPCLNLGKVLYLKYRSDPAGDVKTQQLTVFHHSFYNFYSLAMCYEDRIYRREKKWQIHSNLVRVWYSELWGEKLWDTEGGHRSADVNPKMKVPCLTNT